MQKILEPFFENPRIPDIIKWVAVFILFFGMGIYMTVRYLIPMAFTIPLMLLAAPKILLYGNRNAGHFGVNPYWHHWSTKPYLWAHRWICCNGDKTQQRF